MLDQTTVLTYFIWRCKKLQGEHNKEQLQELGYLGKIQNPDILGKVEETDAGSADKLWFFSSVFHFVYQVWTSLLKPLGDPPYKAPLLHIKTV